MSEHESRTRRPDDDRARPPASRRRAADEPDTSRARKGKTRSKPSESEGATDRRRKSAENGHRIDARRAGALAADYVVAMTGRQPEGLTSLEHNDDGWHVGVEALESRRVPDSTDILALYRVDLDQDGGLVSYRRERRYYRGRVDGEGQ